MILQRLFKFSSVLWQSQFTGRVTLVTAVAFDKNLKLCKYFVDYRI